MGFAEGKSMLYLEARCLYVAKGAGSQGIQNGSVSCVGVPAAVPGGIRAILAENLIAMSLDLECASSNDQSFTHSDLRRVVPVLEEDVVRVRNHAAKAIQAIFRELGLPEITDEEVEAATYARGSEDMPKRNVVEDLKATEDLMNRGITGVDLVKALDRAGFEDVATSVYNMLKQRVSGDYLHTSAILDENFHVMSAVNYPNDYRGPQTGYQITDERWDQLKTIRQAISPEEI